MKTISVMAWPERYTFSPAVRSGNLPFVSGSMSGIGPVAPGGLA